MIAPVRTITNMIPNAPLHLTEVNRYIVCFDFVATVYSLYATSSGIIGAPLLLRFGWRIVAISGAVISCLGFVASAFAPSIWVLYLTYGVMTGMQSCAVE